VGSPAAEFAQHGFFTLELLNNWPLWHCIYTSFVFIVFMHGADKSSRVRMQFYCSSIPNKKPFPSPTTLPPPPSATYIVQT
jgi:hypothetical protein